jgi:serine protease Do
MPPSGSHGRIQQGQGSGVIIDNRGHILTNNHVVGDADSIRVLLLDGRELEAELIGADPASDVAVIRIAPDNLTTARLGDSDSIEVGEWVLAVGNPFGLDFTVTSGIISARGRSGMGMMEIEDFIQTDASINPGNSGGPLVNLNGEVIGINTFIFSRSGSGGSVGVGFAIPSNIAMSVMQSLIAHKQVTASYLGVDVQSLTQDLAQAFGLPSPRGALVKSVTRGSPAEKAGFLRGDVVVRWGRRDIADDQQFRNLVTITTPGQPVDVEVVRDGRTVLLKVTLLASPPEMVVEGKSDRFLQSLGVEVTDSSPEILKKLDYEPDAAGVLVKNVRRDSPGARLGLMPGSLIINVNGKDVHNSQELRQAIAASERSKSYDLVWRNGDLIRRVRLEAN